MRREKFGQERKLSIFERAKAEVTREILENKFFPLFKCKKFGLKLKFSKIKEPITGANFTLIIP